MSDIAIEISGVSKSFGNLKAIEGLSLCIRKGELFGLIGPDGAGKTTLFRLLTTLLDPDEGRLTVDGMDTVRDFKRIRASVGYMPGRFSLYQDLTVEENLEFFASMSQVTVEENYSLIEPIFRQLEPFRKRKAGKLSGGMKQKLALSCALIHKPSVLFLDEPTTGVDAVSRKEFWDMLHRLKEQGLTILVSTPYMDEASRCDRVALMNQGRLLVVDTPERVTHRFEAQLWKVSADRMFRLLQSVRKESGVLKCYPFGVGHHVVTDSGFDANHLLSRLDAEGFRNVVLEKTDATIEDVFIHLESLNEKQ